MRLFFGHKKKDPETEMHWPFGTPLVFTPIPDFKFMYLGGRDIGWLDGGVPANHWGSPIEHIWIFEEYKPIEPDT